MRFGKIHKLNNADDNELSPSYQQTSYDIPSDLGSGSFLSKEQSPFDSFDDVSLAENIYDLLPIISHELETELAQKGVSPLTIFNQVLERHDITSDNQNLRRIIYQRLLPTTQDLLKNW